MLRYLPAPVATYLGHAIEPGARLPQRIRLTMHGHIKVGTWLPFTADETIDRGRGFQWSARIAGGLISGRDELRDDRAASRFDALGVLPVARESGRDFWESAMGRFLAEQAAWMPWSLLPEGGTRWHVDSEGRAIALVPHHRGYTRVAHRIDVDGRLRTLSLYRWGRNSGRYGLVPFGLKVDEERAFGDFTVPSGGRVGWWYGTQQWPTGQFFRFTVDDYVPL